MFDHVGEIGYPPEAGSADTILEAAVDAGADDALSDEDGHLITTSFDSLGTVASALEEALGEAKSVKAVWRPNITSDVDEGNAATILQLIDVLEDDDDVQSVYANFEISDEILTKLTAA